MSLKGSHAVGFCNINKSQFRCPHVVTPFGVAGRGKASREIAYIGHSVGETGAG